MIKYVGAAAVLAAAYGIQGAIEVTTIMLVLFASMFYIAAFRLFVGLSQAALITNVDLLKMITIYMIYITMAVAVFMSPYSYIAIFAAPWLVIQTAINILSALVKVGVIGIERK